MNNIVIIPARLNSSRLPGKVLLEIAGKPMIEHVYESSIKAKRISAVYIATDSLEVRDICLNFTDNVIMTSNKHQSGTDRLAEAVKNIECDGVINVQGDEPLIDPILIDELSLALEKNDIASAMHRIVYTEELKSVNSVKVVVNKNNEALYFSRSIIPHHRDEWNTLLEQHDIIPEDLHFYKHIGIYAYSKEFLLKYEKLHQTYLEKIEKLEQLRILENGYIIKMIKTDYRPIGVDTYDDLEKVREIVK